MRILGLDESHHPKVASMALSAEKFAKSCLLDIRDSGTKFVLAGLTGCGKTHTVERILAYIRNYQVEAWSRGWWKGSHIPSPIMVRWVDAIRLNDDQWNEVVHEATVARLIAIDDLGAENDRYRNDEATVRLHQIWEACSRPWKWLLVTTNVPVAQWKTRWDQRIADRLMACARIDLNSVPSYRVSHPEVSR